MKTILVPTDFSENAANAAMYALALAKQVGCAKIILYNAYEAPVTIDPAMPVMQLINIDDLKAGSNEGLQKLKSRLDTHAPAGITIECENEFSSLTNIDDACERTGAGLIVMGITGHSRLEEVFVGSTTISVVNHTKVPVVIVPSKATYSPIRNILLAVDVEKIAATTPMKLVETLLDSTKAKLYVLNIHKREHNGAGHDMLTGKLLQGYEAEHHRVEHSDYAKAINDFADDRGVDLIVTIPKKHGLFEGLFKRDYTKQLAFHTHVPLMCIHEDDMEIEEG